MFVNHWRRVMLGNSFAALGSCNTRGSLCFVPFFILLTCHVCLFRCISFIIYAFPSANAGNLHECAVSSPCTSSNFFLPYSIKLVFLILQVHSGWIIGVGLGKVILPLFPRVTILGEGSTKRCRPF